MITEINTLQTLIKRIGPLRWADECYSVNIVHKKDVEDSKISFEECDGYLQLDLESLFKGLKVVHAERLAADMWNFASRDLLIVTTNGPCFHYTPGDNTLVNYGEDAFIRLQIENQIAYRSLFSFIKDKQFCDYYNDANTEIVFYSAINGIFKIIYSKIPPSLNDKSISDDVKLFLSIASSVEIRPHLKNAIYGLVQNKLSVHLSSVIENLAGVIEIGQRDYELTMKKFDFEKFRDLLYREKDKYFLSVREIVSKIFGQAVGIPISITAAVFSSYKVESDAVLLGLILLGFLVYTMFYLKVQFMYRNDVIQIQTDFTRDFKVIKQSSGLSADIIDTEGLAVNKKIQDAKSTVEWLMCIVGVLTALVCIYILYQLWQIPFLMMFALLKT